MQMVGVPVGVATEWATGEPVERIVAKALGVAGSAKGPRRARIASRVARSCACPGQPVLLVVAEELVIGSGRQNGGDGGDVAHRVVVHLLVVEHRPSVDLDQLVGHQPSIGVQLAEVAVERGPGGLADVGAGDRAKGAREPAVAHRRQHRRRQTALGPIHARQPALAVARGRHCPIGIGQAQRLARIVIGGGCGVTRPQQGGGTIRHLPARVIRVAVRAGQAGVAGACEPATPV